MDHPLLHGQRFHEDARLNHARWGGEDNEVDLVESTLSLKPVAALEIKWSDKYAGRPASHKGLVRFMRSNRLPLAWATTRSKIAQTSVDGGEIRQWPAAALAFHYGVRAVQGRLAGDEAQIKDLTA